MLGNNGFWGKTKFFLKSNVFDTTSHMIYFDYKHIKKKTIYVLHKLSFHNTVPHRRHSLIKQ